MSKEIAKKYADKIIEVVYYDTIPDKETVCKVIYALVNEYSDQQNKEIKEECINWSLACDKLELKNKELQERVDGLEKSLLDVTRKSVDKIDEQKRIIDEYENTNQQLQAKIDELEKANEKQEIYIFNGIENQLDKIKDIEDAKEYIKDYIEYGDIHPDIESLIVLKKIGGVHIEETGEYKELNGEDVPVCKVNISIIN